jgi:hypothetical protein
LGFSNQNERCKDASYQVLIHFGQAVSEEKIFLEINLSETRMACGGHVC